MAINLSTSSVQVFNVPIRRINFLSNPLIFNGPFYNSTTFFINGFKYQLEHLILITNISTKQLVADSFLRCINRFNTLLAFCHLTIYCRSPLFDGFFVMPITTMMQLGFMHSVSKVLNFMELSCEEVEPLCSSCMNLNFNADFTRKGHCDQEKNKKCKKQRTVGD
ncbi:hypothetical protein V8G54_023193, partial [Vigna mungo]